METISQTIVDITKFLFIGQTKKELVQSDLVLVLGNDYIEGTVAEIFDLTKWESYCRTLKLFFPGLTGC